MQVNSVKGFSNFVTQGITRSKRSRIGRLPQIFNDVVLISVKWTSPFSRVWIAGVSRLKEGEYLASFPELEGCLSEGKTLEEAKKNASEALNGWLASHCDRNLDIPNPKSRKGKNYYPITVDLQITLAIVLRKKRRKKKWTQSQAARKLGITQQAYARLEIPTRANPSLVTLKKLSEALELDIEFSYDLAA